MFDHTVKILRPSPKIETRLQGEPTGLDSYTTRDVVQGSALITPPYDFPIAGVEIHLQGISQTKFYRAINHARSKAQHTFLSDRQPTNEFKCTIPNVLKKGQEYEFPFYFIIPEQLPSRSCNHLAQNEPLKHLHSMLPSSLGDPGCEAIDDYTSDMARISYRIRVKLSDLSTTRCSDKPLSTVTKCIRVTPKTMGEPPTEIMWSTLCWTHGQVLLGNARFGNQPGWLSIDVLQPKPIQIPNSGAELQNSACTTATMKLQYVSIGHSNPPKLESISSTLRVITMYSATPWEDRPDTLCQSSISHGGRGIYKVDLPLSKLSIGTVEWTRQPSDSYIQDGRSHSAIDPASLSPSLHSASILVPITLPNVHRFVPTFHSCFISRVYLVKLSLSCRDVGFLTSTTSLRAPIQIIR